MKNIVNIKPSYGTLDSDFEDKKTAYRKSKAFERWLEQNIPPNIVGKYSFDDIGKTCIRVFIYLDPEDEQSAKNVITFARWAKKNRFKVEKFWREDKGYFAYKLDREYKRSYTSYIILIEQAANIDGCVVKKKRKMKTIFYTDCEKERVEL